MEAPEQTTLRLQRLREPISARLYEHGPGAAEIMRRDLLRYYAGIEDTLWRLQLAKPEACLVCDALNGVWLSEDRSAAHLWAEIDDAIRIDRLDQKWGLTEEQATALVERLRGLTLAQSWAVVDAVERFWAHTDKPTDEALQLAGLVRVQG